MGRTNISQAKSGLPATHTRAPMSGRRASDHRKDLEKDPSFTEPGPSAASESIRILTFPAGLELENRRRQKTTSVFLRYSKKSGEMLEVLGSRAKFRSC